MYIQIQEFNTIRYVATVDTLLFYYHPMFILNEMDHYNNKIRRYIYS